MDCFAALFRSPGRRIQNVENREDKHSGGTSSQVLPSPGYAAKSPRCRGWLIKGGPSIGKQGMNRHPFCSVIRRQNTAETQTRLRFRLSTCASSEKRRLTLSAVGKSATCLEFQL